jgi:hypothetical protein
MSRRIGALVAIAALAGALGFGSQAIAQTAATPTETKPTENLAPTADNAVLLTIFFKHDQSRPLTELNAQLEKQGYYKAFPPPGTEVVSWYVMMGIGQGRYASASCFAPSRSQPHPGEYGLGQLSHRILSDVRLQGGRHGCP